MTPEQVAAIYARQGLRVPEGLVVEARAGATITAPSGMGIGAAVKESLTTGLEPEKPRATLSDVPNATEARFLGEFLEPQRLLGWLLTVPVFQPFTVRLGKNCTYTPDWGALTADGYRVWDVKGTTRTKPRETKQPRKRPFVPREVPWIEADAVIKIKWFREFYPAIPLAVAYKTAEGWQQRWK